MALSSSSPSNQVCSYLSDKNHGRSKAQMCLKKIIDFISSNGSLKNMELESSSKVKVVHKQEYDDDEMKVLSYGKRGFEIDLNLRLGTWLELENDNKGFSACSGVGVGVGVEEEDNILVNINNNNCSSSDGFGGGGGGDVWTVDKSSEGECDPKHVLEQEEEDEEEEERVVVVEEEETRELSEITNLQVNISSEIDNKQTQVRQEEDNKIKAEKQVEVLRKSEGYLDLLVEAAKLISGNFEDDDEEEEKDIIMHEKKKKPMSRNGRLKSQKKEETQIKMKELVGLEEKKWNEEEWMLDCYGEFEDISPIVRSKRGRNQVLPHKYRDSVLEPWKRLTTTSTTTKQRSSRVKQRTK